MGRTGHRETTERHHTDTHRMVAQKAAQRKRQQEANKGVRSVVEVSNGAPAVYLSQCV